MLASPIAAPPSVDYGGGPQHAIMQSMESHCDVPFNENELARPKFGRDALRAYNHKGTVVVASVWLALYIIMSISHLTAPTN
jgi:hypothetical protein